MGRQCVEEDPPGRGDSVSVFVPPSYHKTSRLSTSGRLPSSMTSPISLSMRCRSLRIRTRKASLVSFCSRHDLSRHISRCLFLSHKTRSVQDTICSRHISRCLFLSHNPMSTSPVIEYVAPVSAITYRAPSSVIEYVVPAPVVTYAATSSVIEYVASTPVVFHAAPATLIERNALYTSGQVHEQHV